jgi:hypothetical protein
MERFRPMCWRERTKSSNNILDFRFWIKVKYMKKLFRIRFFGSHSDNPKSAIQNPKMAGDCCSSFHVRNVWAAVEAQQPTKIPRIGFLDRSTASGSALLLETFWQELSKLGWIEGKSITIDYRFAEQKTERLPDLAADLVRLKVDLIVVSGRGPGLAAKTATNTIPIVMLSLKSPSWKNRNSNRRWQRSA